MDDGVIKYAVYIVNTVDSLEEPIEWAYHQSVGKGIGKVEDQKINIFIIPHPASRGGNSISVLNDLRHALAES